jgi:hypothetical protein
MDPNSTFATALHFRSGHLLLFPGHPQADTGETGDWEIGGDVEKKNDTKVSTKNHSQ